MSSRFHRIGQIIQRHYWIPIVIFIALLARQLQFVNHNAVNLMIWDQWSIYDPIFNHKNLWDIFTYQHGPHRQGVGAFLIYILANLSDWDSRWDAFAVSGTLIVAASLAFPLAWKCSQRVSLFYIIPLVFLNIRQYEGFVYASNVSHGAMPVLLLIVLSLCFYIKAYEVRLFSISILTFFLIFTGFGLFAGLLTPLLLGIESYCYFREDRRNEGWMAVLAIVSIAGYWLLFLHDYRFAPAVSEYHFPHEHPLEYLYFVANMLSNYFGMAGHGLFSIFLGLFIASTLLYLCIIHTLKILKQGQGTCFNSVIFLLSAFTLIFCVETAIGRVCLGWESASRASRYVTLIIPGALAIGLHLAMVKTAILARWLTLAYGLFIVCGTLFLKPGDKLLITEWRSGRQLWKETYLATHDENRANEVSRFSIYPGPLPKKQLQYLEKNHLNLFDPKGKP